MWKIEKTVKKGDYLYAVVKGHPNASKYGYVLYHRIVMENHIGRILNPNEVVHHIDGDKFNNIVSNLQLMDCIDHVKLHGLKQGRKYVLLKCPECDTLFEIEHRNSFLCKKKRATFCSRKCSGSFNRKKQLHGLTHEMEVAILGNLVKVFNKFADDNSEGIDNC